MISAMGYEDSQLVGQNFNGLGVTGQVLHQLEQPTGEIVPYQFN